MRRAVLKPPAIVKRAPLSAMCFSPRMAFRCPDKHNGIETASTDALSGNKKARRWTPRPWLSVRHWHQIAAPCDEIDAHHDQAGGGGGGGSLVLWAAAGHFLS